MQLEQELELVLGKQGLQRSFSNEWSQKWVPAIIVYCKGLKRKDIRDMIKELESGNFSLHVFCVHFLLLNPPPLVTSVHVIP